ncbi:MAG TPA: iron-containing alcohol dehydrogenase [Candidatus Coprousia avicola]|nr:iron-containing alcohol dehydrogenase [Candidatus Coprousia avicola]
MHPVRKIWCRIYQTAFRIALPVLPYREPKPLASFADAAALLAEKRVRRVLIVTDKNIMRLGLTRELEDDLADAGIAASIYDEVVPNPTIANVEAARERYLADGCEALIAFGGGSAMDCAKVVGARLARPKKPVTRMRGILRVLLPLPLLIAVPTTAGTGSETTLAAVITDGETHYKYPINDFCLIPRYAVLDYRTTLGLPPAVTATTGMDALVHATEAYIGRSTTRETRSRAIEAVRLIRTYLLRAYRDGADAKAREHMLRAAYCAGIAFTKSYVGYVHAVAHSLGGQYGIAHGLANAVLLPHVLDAYGASCERRLADLARRSGVAAEGTSDHDASQAFIAWVRKMNAAMGIPTTLSGIRDEDIPVMAKRADAEGNPLYPVPLLMDATELESLYHSVQEPAPAGAADESGEQAAATEDVAGSETDAARMPAASLPHRLAHAVRTQIRRARRAARRAGSRIRTNR